MTHPHVRFATKADLPALQQFDEWPTIKAWQQRIDYQQVVVVEDESGIQGLIRYTNLWTTVPFMELIVVHPSRRGKGYSRLLLDFLMQDLRKQGFVALLSSSQTDEPAPQAWHQKMGFASNGIIENIADEGIGELVYRIMLYSDMLSS